MPGVSLGSADALRPDRPVGPDVDFLDRAESVGAEQFDAGAEAVGRRALVAHLGAEVLLGGELPHYAGFLDGPGQRLLAEAVLAHLHGHDAGRGVGVVGRAHGDGVDLAVHLLEHLAVVEVLLGVRELLGLLVERLFVDVAEGDDLAVAAGVVRVAIALAADADAGEADFLIDRRFTHAGDGGRGGEQERARAGQRRLSEEATTVLTTRHLGATPGDLMDLFRYTTCLVLHDAGGWPSRGQDVDTSMPRRWFAGNLLAG